MGLHPNWNKEKLNQSCNQAHILHQSTAASMWWCGPRPCLGWVKMAVGLPEGPSYPRHSPSFFSLCCPLNDCRRAAHSFKIGRLFSLFLFSCPSLAFLHLLILLLLLMSSNVHPNPGPIFPCSVCTGNVTWWGKSVQCCICSKWVHQRCSQLSLSQFRALGSSHSWSCPPCRNTVTSPSPQTPPTRIPPLWNLAPPLLMLHSCPTLVSKPLIPHLLIPYLFPLHLLQRPLLLAIFLHLLPSLPPDSLRVLQWNAGGLRARSTELLHFLSSHPVNLICIQESNLNSSSFFWIPGFSALLLIAPTLGLAFSPPIPCTLAAALSFSSGRAYLFLNFLPPLFLCLIPTLIM